METSICLCKLAPCKLRTTQASWISQQVNSGIQSASSERHCKSGMTLHNGKFNIIQERLRAQSADHTTKIATRASWSLPPLPKFSSPTISS